MSDAINIDLTDIRDPNLPIPDDVYVLEVTDAELRKSQEKQENMVSISTEVVEGEHAGFPIYENAMLEGRGARQGLWRIRQLLVAADKPTANWSVSDLVGIRFSAKVGTQPARGQYSARNRIDDVIVNR